MLTFHNDSKIKATYLARVKTHMEADEIAKGFYWENGKGCAVGCTIHGSDHKKYETELGIPQAIAQLEDTIFEGLENELAKKWPLRFLKAVKPGKDLSLVTWEFLHWLQIENLANAKKQKMPSDVIGAIKACVLVLEPMTKGAKVDEKAALSAAAWAARAAAAWSARATESAWSAARAAESAWSAARAAESAWAARAAAWAARSAARAAWSAAAESAAESAWSAARQECYAKMADKLIAFIKGS